MSEEVLVGLLLILEGKKRCWFQFWSVILSNITVKETKGIPRSPYTSFCRENDFWFLKERSLRNSPSISVTLTNVKLCTYSATASTLSFCTNESSVMLRRIKKASCHHSVSFILHTGVVVRHPGCSTKENRLNNPGYMRWLSSQRRCPPAGVQRQRGSPPLLCEPPASPPLSWPWAPGLSCTPWLWAAGWRCCWPCSFPGTCWCWSRWAGRWPWR